MPAPTAIFGLPKIDTNEFMNEVNLHALWDAIDAAMQDFTMTTAERNALSGPQLWVGRLIYNTTTSEWEVCTNVAPDPGGAWADLLPTLSTEEVTYVGDQAKVIMRRLTGADFARVLFYTGAVHKWSIGLRGDTGEELNFFDEATGATRMSLLTTGVSLSGLLTLSSDAVLKRVGASQLAARNAADSAYGEVHADIHRANQFRDLTNSDRNLRWGAGSPEGAITANVGAVYLRNDGGAETTIYEKATGSGNTGWIAIASTNHTHAASVAAQAEKNDAAAITDWVARIKRTADTQYRAVLEDGGLLLGPGGATAPDLTLRRDDASAAAFMNAAQNAYKGARMTTAFLQTAIPAIQFEAYSDRELSLTAGSPEGAVTANVGSVAFDTTNGIVYVKKTGSGNTGWQRLDAGRSCVRNASDITCPNGTTNLTDLSISVSGTTPIIVEVELELDNSSGSSITFQPGIDKSGGGGTIRWSAHGHRSDLNQNMYWVGQTTWGISGSATVITTGTKMFVHMIGVHTPSGSGTIFPCISNSNAANLTVKTPSFMRAVVI